MADRHIVAMGGGGFSDDDPLRLFRTFITLVYLTRSLVET